MIKKTGSRSSTKSVAASYQRPHDQWQEIVVQVENADKDAAVVTRKSRSLRWRRWVFTLSVTAFTFGALMVGLGTPSIRNELMAPGDLCSSHAQILAGQGVDRCAACHPGGGQSFSQWASAAVFGADVDLPTQSELCMKCHEQSLDRHWAMNPHGVDPVMLSSRSNAGAVSIVGQIKQLARMPAPTGAGEIACSVCHREHHGSENDLTALTDRQCQVCHQNVFHSFEEDHPPFGSYPLQRRSSIAFDHASHFVKHFPGAKQAFDCAMCHLPDGSNNVQRLASFEQSCAECHQQKIEVMSEPGLALFALPTLDMDAIEAQGTNVGGWPLAATGDFDGPLPPVMRLLLLADPAAQEVLDQKDVHFDFSDFDPDQAKDVADSVILAWSIKRLLFELARDGRPAIARRIQEVTGVDVGLDVLKGLSDSLEASVFQNSANRWLPDLKAEVGDQVPAYEVSQSPHRSLPRLGLQRQPKIEWSNQTVAALATAIRKTSQQNATLQDQPQRDGSQWLAVNPLTGSVDASAVAPVGASGGEAIVEQPQSDESEEVASDSTAFVAQQGGRENSEWLATNPLSSEARATGGEARATGGNAPAVANRPKASSAPGRVRGAGASQPPRATVWGQDDQPAVGWVRDDGRFQLRYQPTGHADETLKNWIDLVGQLSRERAQSQLESLFGLLMASEGLGDCRRCHTADRQTGGQLLVNWRPEYRDPAVASFTRFSHGPHLTLPQLRDCSACHRLNPEQGNQDSFASFDMQEFQSNFAALSVSDCASCHRSGSTSNSCTQCHSYHVGMRSER